jgi:hypothetical protein
VACIGPALFRRIAEHRGHVMEWLRSAQKSAPTNFVMKFAGELARVRFGRLFGGVGQGEGDGIVGGLKVCRRPAHPIIDIQP